MIAVSAFKAGVLAGMILGALAATVLLGVLAVLADDARDRPRRRDTFSVPAWLDPPAFEDPPRGPARILDFPTPKA